MAVVVAPGRVLVIRRGGGGGQGKKGGFGSADELFVPFDYVL